MIHQRATARDETTARANFDVRFRDKRPKGESEITVWVLRLKGVADVCFEQVAANFNLPVLRLKKPYSKGKKPGSERGK